ELPELACWVWKPIKPNSASIILKRYDYVDVRDRSRSVMAWVPKKDRFSKGQLRDIIKRCSEEKSSKGTRNLKIQKLNIKFKGGLLGFKSITGFRRVFEL
nr:hypothetical protein [Tanacetum cinerariifolium]